MSATIVEAKLREEFEPSFLTVEDLSDGCGAKISCVIVSAKFEGLALLARHRAVNTCLAKEMETIHALQMKTWTATQYEKKRARMEAGSAST
jgi:stress-induced morphogen